MSGRIKIIDEHGEPLYRDDFPFIDYEYEQPSAYDDQCGTYGLEKFALPHSECPNTFICNKPDGPVGKFAECIDSMNCAMAVGMTSNVHMNSGIALFIHQMVPHHQNAVNMCKALFKSGEVRCSDIENEEDPHCQMKRICYDIINGQNHQIQMMREILDSFGFAQEDDCKLDMTKTLGKKSRNSNRRK